MRALKRRSVREQADQRLEYGDLVVDLPQGAAELDGTVDEVAAPLEPTSLPLAA